MPAKSDNMGDDSALQAQIHSAKRTFIGDVIEPKPRDVPEIPAGTTEYEDKQLERAEFHAVQHVGSHSAGSVIPAGELEPAWARKLIEAGAISIKEQRK